jgi:pimeloyl-ACP methyl ester carboxylesterase
VSITIPADVPIVPWLSGSPEQVVAFADDLLSVSVTLDDLDTTANANSTYDGWEGAAAASYGTYVGAAAENAQTSSLALRAVAAAADTYATELQRLLDERERLVDARTTFNADCDSLRASVDAAAPEDDLSELRAVASELATRRTTIVDDIATMETDTTANEDDLRSVLTANASVAAVLAAPGGGIDPADAAMGLPGAPGSGGSAQDTAAWWAALTPAQRYAVLAAHPEVIGSADGLPAEVRDEANRALLTADLEALELLDEQGRLPSDLRKTLENAQAAHEALGNVVVDPVSDPPVEVPPLLHLYDPNAFDGEGAVAIAYGNPDTADNVSTIVPGTTVKGTSIAGDVRNAENLYTSARVSDPNATTSTILWIGYDSPEFTDLSVASESMAIAGGERLADYVDGLNAARAEGDPAHMSVVGHSYGSTTVGRAATDHGLAVDDIIAIGSPGLGDEAQNAGDLGGPEVWVGNASRDPVARLGDNGWVGLGADGLGQDPAEQGFGATRFEAEDVNRADESESADWGFTGNMDGTSFDDHSRYFNDGTESLHNMGRIVAGDDGDVGVAEGTYDPWYSGPVDPEFDRDPQAQPSIVVEPDR